VATHAATGGIVPEVAARLQLELIHPVIDQALSEASCTWADIEAIAVTHGPGLIGSLLVGVETAKTLAYAKSLPLIPVNHLAGHLYAAVVASKFEFPYVGLIVSGGHTELLYLPGHTGWELLGETRDDAAGEAFDKVAKLLGLSYPGGPALAKLAAGGNPISFDFPRAMLTQPNLDFSFSGLKTAVSREITSAPLSSQRRANIAASFQTAVIEVLVAKTVRAAIEQNVTTVLLGGGVAANQALRSQLATALNQENITLSVAAPKLTTDNAAMIGLAAYWQREAALSDPAGLVADSSAPVTS